MKQTTLNMLSDHALSIITGFLAGMVFIAGMSNISALETKDYWQTIGSLGAGFGTLGLLLFGIKTSNLWIKQNKQKASLDVSLAQLKELNRNMYKLSHDCANLLTLHQTQIHNQQIALQYKSQHFIKNSMETTKSYIQKKHEMKDKFYEIRYSLSLLLVTHDKEVGTLVTNIIEASNALEDLIFSAHTVTAINVIFNDVSDKSKRLEKQYKELHEKLAKLLLVH